VYSGASYTSPARDVALREGGEEAPLLYIGEGIAALAVALEIERGHSGCGV
jgi:hypothetical protein